MIDIYVGCVTYLPDPEPNRYFNVKMSVDKYPTTENKQELIEFLQPNVDEIVDDVIYIYDLTLKCKVWEND